jgi:uncharacterized protein
MPNNSMENTSQQAFDSAAAQASQPSASEHKLLAPVWHTALLVTALLANSFFSAKLMSTAVGHGAEAISANGQAAGYALNIGLEFLILLFVWFGLRLRGMKIRDLIGGRWKTPEDFLLDVGIAVGFLVASWLILAGLSFALGLAKTSQIEETKKLVGVIAPRGWLALLSFFALSTSAGFIEEIVFRGYLQRQFAALTRNTYIGLVVSALCFGLAHGYEGIRRMVLIAIFGCMFGLLAHFRKNLRPGMMAHGAFDALQGLLLYFLARKGLPSMH